MQHGIAIILTLLWSAANVWLWSLRQEPLTLFWQCLGMAAVAYPIFGWYVRRSS
jgi:hypothetical protein